MKNIQKYLMFAVRLMLLSICLIILGVILSIWTPDYIGVIVGTITGLPILGLLIYSIISFEKSEALLNRIVKYLFFIDIIINLMFL